MDYFDAKPMAVGKSESAVNASGKALVSASADALDQFGQR